MMMSSTTNRKWMFSLLMASVLLVGSEASLSLPVPPSSTQRRRRSADQSSWPTRGRPDRVLLIPRGGGGDADDAASSVTVVLNAFWKAHPLAAGATVCAVKAALADLVAQRLQFRAKESSGKQISWDPRRTLAFMLFGGLYQGVVQGLMINNFYTYLFGSATTATVVTKKVLFNAIFQDAMLCIPTAYIVKAFVFQYSIQTALRNYWDDVRYHGLLHKNFAIWLPVNCFIFAVVPPHFRTTVMACVSFLWMIILSSISSRSR